MNAKAKLINWDRLGEVITELQAQERWQDLLLVSVATFTGCRPSDWTGFTWGTFLVETGVDESGITLARVNTVVSIFEKKPVHIMRAKGKKAHPRPIFLLTQFREILQACWIGRGRPYMFRPMFLGKRGPKGKSAGISTNTANDWINTLAIEFSLPHITTYSFRKTGGRKIHDSTTDPKEAVQLARRFYNHTSATSTMAYIGYSDEEVVCAFDKLRF